MTVQLNSAVHDDLREAIEYYDRTAGSEIAIDFHDEFLRLAGLAADAPRTFRIYREDSTEIQRVNLQ
ncbi:MAG: hypothetical protein AB7Q37_14035 [Pyrinomonadaceae bacterium]